MRIKLKKQKTAEIINNYFEKLCYYANHKDEQFKSKMWYAVNGAISALIDIGAISYEEWHYIYYAALAVSMETD